VVRHRDRFLLHGFEQRRLGFRRGAVDFVRQHEIGEHGTRLEAPRLRAPIFRVFEDVRPGDVGGHQVRRELDARKFQVERVRQCLDQHGFAESRHAFEQRVPPREDADQHGAHHLILSDDHALDFRLNRLREAAELF